MTDDADAKGNEQHRDAQKGHRRASCYGSLQLLPTVQPPSAPDSVGEVTGQEKGFVSGKGVAQVKFMPTLEFTKAVASVQVQGVSPGLVAEQSSSRFQSKAKVRVFSVIGSDVARVEPPHSEQPVFAKRHISARKNVHGYHTPAVAKEIGAHLSIGRNFANRLCGVIGPASIGDAPTYPGIVRMALVGLYKVLQPILVGQTVVVQEGDDTSCRQPGPFVSSLGHLLATRRKMLMHKSWGVGYGLKEIGTVNHNDLVDWEGLDCKAVQAAS